jgi:hypothetical protein
MALFQPLLTFGLDAGSTVARADGTFAFAHLAPATYLLRIRHGDFAPRTRRGLVVAEGGSLDLGTLPLARGTRLSGSVTLDGAPLEGARVQVLVVAADELPRGYCGEARSDAGGGWQLAQRLPPGRYLVLAGRVVPDNPFQESADEALTRAEVEIAGEAERSVAIAITGPPPAQRK